VASPTSAWSATRGPWTVLLTHALLVQLLTFVIRPTTTYRALELGLNSSLLGLLSACFAVTPLILAVPSGALADRLGERSMALAGAAFIVTSVATLTWAGRSLTALVCGTVLLGLGHLFSVIAEQTWVANRVRGTGADRAFGRYTFAASSGQTIGPALMLPFGAGRALPDTDGIFVAACAAAVLLVVVSLCVTSSGRTAGDTSIDTSRTTRLLQMPGLARALLTSCVVLAAVDITLAYLPALGAERGISAGTVGLLLALRGLTSMASRIALGRLVDRLGRRRLLVSFTMLSAAGMAAAALPWGMPFLAVSIAVTGFGLGVGQPLTMSWLSDSAPAGARGKAMSLRIVGNRAGQVVLPTAAGAMAATTGAAGVLIVTGASLAAVALAARHLPSSTAA
jgi:MFS family permease